MIVVIVIVVVACAAAFPLVVIGGRGVQGRVEEQLQLVLGPEDADDRLITCMWLLLWVW